MGFGEDSSSRLRGLAEKKVNRPTPALDKLRPKQEESTATHTHPDQDGAAKTPLLERLLAQAQQEVQDAAAIDGVRKTLAEMQAAEPKREKNEPSGGLTKLLHTEGDHDQEEKIAPVVKAFLRGEAPGKITSR